MANTVYEWRYAVCNGSLPYDFTTILSILKDWEEREREISGYRLLKIGEMMEDGDESLVPYYIENDGFIVEIKYTFIKQVGCKGLPVMPYSVIRRKIRE